MVGLFFSPWLESSLLIWTTFFGIKIQYFPGGGSLVLYLTRVFFALQSPSFPRNARRPLGARTCAIAETHSLPSSALYHPCTKVFRLFRVAGWFPWVVLTSSLAFWIRQLIFHHELRPSACNTHSLSQSVGHTGCLLPFRAVGPVTLPAQYVGFMLSCLPLFWSMGSA